mmetsp:Transcript_10738/g.15041  ORF Transcript_10738/g.15041 Transcript_10738/m.15041 type:complete len:1058 (+) Transcript_10738:183-3356(+)
MIRSTTHPVVPLFIAADAPAAATTTTCPRPPGPARAGPRPSLAGGGAEGDGEGGDPAVAHGAGVGVAQHAAGHAHGLAVQLEGHRGGLQVGGPGVLHLRVHVGHVHGAQEGEGGRLRGLGEEEGGQRRRQGQAQLAGGLVHGEGLRPGEHQVPHAGELGRCAREPRHEALAPGLLVQEGRGGNEGGGLQRRPAVHLHVHPGGHAHLRLGPELVVQPPAQQLQVELVAHVHPDGLVLQPARREALDAAGGRVLCVQVLADLVHAEHLVLDARDGHAVVLRQLLLPALHHLEVAHGALQVHGQHRGRHALHRDVGAARVGAVQHRVGGGLPGEVGGGGAVAQRLRPRDAHVHARQHGRQQRAQIGGRPGHLVAAEGGGEGGAVSLQSGAGLVPVVEVVQGAVVQGGQVGPDGLEQGVQLLGHRGVHAEPGRRVQVVQGAVELESLGGGGAEERGQAVHGVQPAGLAALHLHAHALRVQHGELDRAQQQHLGGQRHLVALPGDAPGGLVARAALPGVAGPVAGGAPGLLVHHGRHLPRRVPQQHVLDAPGQHVHGRDERLHRVVPQHVRLHVGEDRQVGADQVQVVGPVVAPVALPEGGVEVLLRLVRGQVKQRVRVQQQGGVAVGEHRNVAGGQRLGGEHGPQLRLALGVAGGHGRRHKRVLVVGGQEPGGGGDCKGVVAVGLDQGVEVQRVAGAHVRLEHDLAPAVLVDVAEVARALGEVRRLDVEGVVVTLQVAVDARVDVVHLLRLRGGAEQQRVAAAHDVVQEVVAHERVEDAVGRAGGHGARDLVQQLVRAVGLGVQIALGHGGGHDVVDQRVQILGLPVERVDSDVLPRLQHKGGGRQRHGRARHGSLRGIDHGLQAVGGEELHGLKQRLVLAEDHVRVRDEGQPAVRALHPGEGVVALDHRGHNVRVGCGGGLLVPGQRLVHVHVVHREPGLLGGGQVLHGRVRHAVGEELDGPVQHLHRQRLLAAVRHRHRPHQAWKCLFHKVEIQDVGLDAELCVVVFNLNLIHTDIHVTRRLPSCFFHERLVIKLLSIRRTLHESSETSQWGLLVGLGC